MQIQVNDNIDKYKDEFFKGFSAKETFCAALVVVVYLACYVVFDFLLGVPQQLALYLALPIPLVVGLFGFLSLTGHDVFGALKEKRKMKEMPMYRYRSGMLEGEIDGFTDERKDDGKAGEIWQSLEKT